jgi:hypothetical protein
VADRIDQPAEARRIAATEDHERAACHADDRRSGQGREPFGRDFLHQARPQSDHPGRADEVALIGLTGAKRQFARKLHRVGADPVIGRDPAESAQAPVERRPLAERRRGLHHLSSSLSHPGLAGRTTVRAWAPMLAGAAGLNRNE